MTRPRPRPQYARSLSSGRTIMALILRDIATSGGRLSLGYLWVIVEPVVGIFLMTLVFSMILVAPPLGTNFALFYASGLLPFLMYLSVSTKIAAAVRSSRPLLAYPGVTFLDAILARFILECGTEFLVFLLIVAGIVGWYGLDTIFDLPALLLGLAMVAALALGIGTLNCLLMSRFALWERIWGILNRPLMILSGIFFLFADVPQPWRDGLWWNPIIHLVGQVRAGLYPTYDASYVSPGYVLGLSALCFVAGLFFLRRYWREIVHEG